MKLVIFLVALTLVCATPRYEKNHDRQPAPQGFETILQEIGEEYKVPVVHLEVLPEIAEGVEEHIIPVEHDFGAALHVIEEEHKVPALQEIGEEYKVPVVHLDVLPEIAEGVEEHIMPVEPDFGVTLHVIEEEHMVPVVETERDLEAALQEIGEEFKVLVSDIESNIMQMQAEIEKNEEYEDKLNIPIDTPKTHLGTHYIESQQEMQAMGINTMNINSDLLEDAFLLVPELIQKHGYPAERHTVQTSVGYLLEMHRIPYSPRNGPGQRKQPVFLMHGLLDSSSTWVIMRPDSGLAYLLADLGYDVWMGNARGNRYSRRHVSSDPDGGRSDRRRFWEFSWHEVGVTDLPRMIDYVLEQTSFEKLHYIGHSQGTTSFFLMASERPAYNEKILSIQALAPVAFMSNLRSPFVRAASYFLNTLDTATSVLGIYEFLPTSELLALGGQSVCRDEAWTQALCYNVLFLIAGFNSAQTNTTMIPVMLGHTPSGASANQLIHYGQGVRSSAFRQYDWGMVSNLWTYGSIRPPTYNLRNVRAPVALHYSANDWLAEPVDVEELHQALPNVIGKFFVPDPQFNHLDFVWAIDVKTLLYDRVFQIMRLVEQGVLPFH